MPQDRPELTLYYHPLSSYCWKVLIALYEYGTPFAGQIVQGRPRDDPAFRALWPIAKFPVLHDAARGETVPESSIIIDYLQSRCPGPARLIPEAADAAREVRLWDRFFDLYVHTPMQKLVLDHMRPQDQKDPAGAVDARATLDTAYAMLEPRMADRRWAMGEDFSLADCAALPPLFYCAAAHPFAERHPALTGYVERLLQRPSVSRTLQEARPYLGMFPLGDRLDPRFTASDR